MKKLLAQIAARRVAVMDGPKKYFAADFAKTAFSNQVVIEGTAPLPFRLERRWENEP
jgi:hypothetical protein